MDLALNNLQRLICHKTQQTNQPSNWVSGISTRTIHQSTTPSLSQTIQPRWASRQFPNLPIVQTLLPVTFGYSLSSQAVVMKKLRRWKSLWRRSLTRSHKTTSMWPCRSCWNGTTMHCSRRRLLRRGLEVHVCTINKSANTKKVWKLIVCTSYIFNSYILHHLDSCPAGWGKGCRIHRQHLYRGVRLSQTSVLRMTLNNQMVRLQ